jgi:hypothetical protein
MRVGRWISPALVGALGLWAAPAFSDGTEPVVPFWPKGAKINFYRSGRPQASQGK